MTTLPQKKKRARKPRRRRCKHTVLWVDDDPNVPTAVARQLRRQSIHVIPASDGMQGYWLALTRSPDAIITDLWMPRWRGEELIDCLSSNAATRNIPVILLSGHVADLSRSFSSDYDIRAVLEKPIDLDLVVQVLRACWSQREDNQRLPDECAAPA